MRIRKGYCLLVKSDTVNSVRRVLEKVPGIKKISLAEPGLVEVIHTENRDWTDYPPRIVAALEKAGLEIKKNEYKAGGNGW